MKVRQPGEYRMRNGQKAIVCSVNGVGEQPILGCMPGCGDDGKDAAVRWFSNGSYLYSMQLHHYDIVDVWSQTYKPVQKLEQPTVIISPTYYPPLIWWYALISGACGGMLVDLLTAVMGWGIR